MERRLGFTWPALFTLSHQKYESHLDRDSTGSGSDLVQPSESKMPITDQVATAPCTVPTTMISDS